VWLTDGYLASPRYPLATHFRWRDEDVNYLTAPYVAAVDAEHGATRLYLRPGAAAFAASVARSEGIEPLPHDSLPSELSAQLGYPAALLGAQATVLARFGRDSAGAPVEWALAHRDTVARGDLSHIEPAYGLLDLGDGVRPCLVLPLSDRGGNRLTALVVGGQDDSGAARLRVLTLDGEFPTPLAVGLRLSRATAALAINAAAAQTDGTVRHGAVVPVPVGGTVAYVAAVFATERRTARPMTLRAIGVASGTRAGFGLDAREAALAAARGEASAGSLTGAEALQAARAAFLALDSAVRGADWTQFGRAYTQLRRALNLDTSVQP